MLEFFLFSNIFLKIFTKKGMFQVKKECYSELKLSFDELISLIKEINEIQIAEKNFKIKKVFGAT